MVACIMLHNSPLLGHCHVLHAMVSQMRACRLSLHVMVSRN